MTTRNLTRVLCVAALAAGLWTSDTAAATRPAHTGARTVPADRLPGVLARLDRARVQGRTALRRAGSAAGQADAARALAAAHLAAARELRPLAGPAQRPLADGLAEAGRAYRALARAATGEARHRYEIARRDVGRADARLAALVDRAARDERPRPADASPQPAAARGSRTPLLEIVAALVLLAGAALWWRHGRRGHRSPPSRPPSRQAAASAPAPCPARPAPPPPPARDQGPWAPGARPSSPRWDGPPPWRAATRQPDGPRPVGAPAGSAR